MSSRDGFLFYRRAIFLFYRCQNCPLNVISGTRNFDITFRLKTKQTILFLFPPISPKINDVITIFSENSVFFLNFFRHCIRFDCGHKWPRPEDAEIRRLGVGSKTNFRNGWSVFLFFARCVRENCWTFMYRPWASCPHTCASVTKEYNLVLVKWWWWFAARKVTAS